MAGKGKELFITYITTRLWKIFCRYVDKCTCSSYRILLRAGKFCVIFGSLPTGCYYRGTTDICCARRGL